MGHSPQLLVMWGILADIDGVVSGTISGNRKWRTIKNNDAAWNNLHAKPLQRKSKADMYTLTCT